MPLSVLMGPFRILNSRRYSQLCVYHQCRWHLCMIKGIVQPKRGGGVKRGTSHQSIGFAFLHNRRCFLDKLKGLLSCCKFEKTGYSRKSRVRLPLKKTDTTKVQIFFSSIATPIDFRIVASWNFINTFPVFGNVKRSWRFLLGSKKSTGKQMPEHHERKLFYQCKNLLLHFLLPIINRTVFLSKDVLLLPLHLNPSNINLNPVQLLLLIVRMTAKSTKF